jgi:hypothetical protein
LHERWCHGECPEIGGETWAESVDCWSGRCREGGGGEKRDYRVNRARVIPVAAASRVYCAR